MNKIILALDTSNLENAISIAKKIKDKIFTVKIGLELFQFIYPELKNLKIFSKLDPAKKKLFLNWVLTAETHGYPNEWFEIFKQAKYSGDWFWTKV